MSLVARVGEGLARRVDRRLALKRVATALFGVTAAVTTRGFRGSEALASHCAIIDGGECGCDPAYGQFCGDFDSTWCSGSSCAGGCYYDETYYPGACWCSATCEYGSGQAGYYQCCDCNCFGTTCACHNFVQVGWVGDEDEESGPPIPPRPGTDDDDALATPGRPPRPDFPEGFPFNDDDDEE